MKKTGSIIFSAILVLFFGVSVAYYNTSSFGYDNTNIVTINNDSIKIYDYKIEYERVKEIANEINDIIPKEFVAI